MKIRPFSRKRLWIATTAAAALVLGLLMFFPVSVERQLRGVCLVECRSHYAVAVRPGDTLFFSGIPADTLLHGIAIYADSATTVSRRTGFFCSNDGLLLTSADLHRGRPARLNDKRLRPLLEKEHGRLLHLKEIYARQSDELDYYARTHTVTDEGYNDVMAFRSHLERHRSRLDSLLSLFDEALRQKRLEGVREDRYEVTYRQMADSGKLLACSIPADAVATPDTSVLVLQLRSRLLPDGAFRFVPYLLSPSFWTPRPLPGQLFGYLLYDVPSEGDAIPIPDAVRTADAPPGMTVASGAPVVNVFGQLVGMKTSGGVVGAHALRRAVYGARPYPAALWHNMTGWWRQRFAPPTAYREIPAAQTLPLSRNLDGRFMAGRRYGHLLTDTTAYHGSLAGGERDGTGRMCYADGSCYSGGWARGKRSGFGTFTDTLGRSYTGIWRADTLPEGLCSDREGIYRGSFGASLAFEGLGSYRTDNGVYYYGQWQAGRRHGFGYAIEPKHIVRCGIWREGRFRGEQMVYTARRIYGIDISRYQHERGRRRFSIDWSRLRITDLGPTARQHAKGKTDYPVSFLFIKASQGTSIRNRYYAADAANARRRGIAVGAYHFFSTRPGSAQADFFLKTAAPRHGDLPPVLDVELTRRQIAAMGGEKAMFREMLAWLKKVEARVGTRPILYVSQQFVNTYMPDAPEALRRYDVWIARYGEYRPYVRLLFWQLTSRGRVAGIRTEVDINVFNGSKEQFDAYRKKACVK